MRVSNRSRRIAQGDRLESGSVSAGADRAGAHPRFRDRVRIINSIVFLVLGLVILYRVAEVHLTLQGVLVGGAFVAFGIYRLRLIWQYFHRKE
ncbi:MAG: hypothetical protein HY314_04775 [Acidobacteria bacterium]|nr:hypothetical protein [Acidobacteriota bacterium]